MLCRSDLLFFNRLKNKPAAATPIPTFGLGFHNGEEHAAADVTRFVNLHVRLLQFAGAIFKFDNHIYLSQGGQKPDYLSYHPTGLHDRRNSMFSSL